MGLSPDVLNRLLVTEDEYNEPSHPHPTLDAVSNGLASPTSLKSDDDVLEFEFESDEAPSPPLLQGPHISDPALSRDLHSKAPEVTLDRVRDGSGEAGPSSSAHRRKFRLRLLSDVKRPHTPPGGLLSSSYDSGSKFRSKAERDVRPMGVTDMLRSEAMQRSQTDKSRARRQSEGSERSRSGSADGRRRRVVRMGEGHQGVKAEYKLAGEYDCGYGALSLESPAVC